MKTGKAANEKTISGIKTAKKNVNPFIKLMEDQKRIAAAVNNDQPLSSLKDIKFVRPLQD